MTTIKEIPFNPDTYSATAELFSESISKDDWIVYHGTSSVYERDIERSGFHPSTNIASKEEVQEVVSVFKKMKWCGNHGGGLSVLEIFSLDHDLADPKGKPIFFAESSYWASLYAMRNFSGGECARALRYALNDLQKYLESTAMREEHNKQLRSKFKYIKYDEEQYRKAVSPVDLQWLKHEMGAFQTLLQSCHVPYDNHTHGVVYSVKFSKDDLGPSLEYDSSMGIKSFTPVSPEHIVAKVKVPLDFQRPPNLQDDKKIDILHNKRGLYATF